MTTDEARNQLAELAIAAYNDTPYETCGECLGDGIIIVTNAAGEPVRGKGCESCGGDGEHVSDQAIRNAAFAVLSDVSLLMTALDGEEEFRSDCDCGSDSDLIEVRWVTPWQEVQE